MFGNPRFLLDRESLKPKRTSETLLRLVRLFTPWWPALLLTVLFMIISTWVQVTTPELTGQVVDCYLSPAAADTFANSPLAGNVAEASQSSCWLAADVEAANPTQAIIKFGVSWLHIPVPASAAALSNAERIGGLAGMVVVWMVLFVASAVLTGSTFYTMSWAGQHVLRGIRVNVFSHLHHLSIGYYAEHEVGDLMSRITNDSDTIQQALNFALVNLVSGFLLLGWIAYNMFTRNLPFALLSMAVAPLMFIATLWFSGQARKAFRKTRVEMGSVNANLQESITAVREAQAFNRAEENIENFRATSASYRDANVRAVAFTSALAPVLEALGYLGLAVVTVVGGLALLNGSDLFGTVVSIGLVITFLGYVQRFNQPIQQISVLWGNIQSAIAGAERIFGLLDVEPAIVDRMGANEIEDIQGRVEFDHVNAEYKTDEPVLKGVNFVAEPGQTMAIVGPTGAGKTTIINLIPRFYDVTGGAVKVDGIAVRDLQAESLRGKSVSCCRIPSCSAPP